MSPQSYWSIMRACTCVQLKLQHTKDQQSAKEYAAAGKTYWRASRAYWSAQERFFAAQGRYCSTV